MKTLHFLFIHLDHLRRRLLSLCIAGTVDGALSFGIPAYLAWISRERVEAGSIPRVALILLVLYFASHGLQWLFRRYAEALGPELALHLRRKYLRALMALPLGRYQERLSGYYYALISRVSDGLSAITVELVWGVSRTATHLVLSFAALAAESSLLLAFNLIVLVLFLGVSRYFAVRMQPIVQEGGAIRAATVGHHAEVASLVPLLARLGAFKFGDELVDRYNQKANVAFDRQQLFHANRWLVLHTIFSIAVVVSAVVLLYRIADGAAPLSVLILFMGALGMVKANAERFAESMRSYLELATYRKLIEEYIEPAASVPMPQQSGELREIALTNLRFSHPQSSVVIGANDLVLKKGECVLLEGPSGAGKTTLLNLIGGWFEPTSGERVVNGRPIKGPLGSAVLVTQDGELMNVSVRENLTLGHSIDEATLVTLLDEVGLDKWSKSLPDGLDTVVGERGATASHGQRQRLTLIRAALLERELYLIDEPTSNLDEATEQLVIRFIEKRLAGKMLVIASHRPGLARLASKRWTFDAHTVVAV